MPEFCIENSIRIPRHCRYKQTEKLSKLLEKNLKNQTAENLDITSASLEIEELTQIVEYYKKTYNISSLKDMLMVDAISFIPTVFIDELGFISCMVKKMKLNNKKLQKNKEISYELGTLAKRKFSNETITNCFVLYVQPINPFLPKFPKWGLREFSDLYTTMRLKNKKLMQVLRPFAL